MIDEKGNRGRMPAELEKDGRLLRKEVPMDSLDEKFPEELFKELSGQLKEGETLFSVHSLQGRSSKSSSVIDSEKDIIRVIPRFEPMTLSFYAL